MAGRQCSCTCEHCLSTASTGMPGAVGPLLAAAVGPRLKPIRLSSVAHLQDIPQAEETARLALVDLDWDHISAEDILAVLRSFLKRGQSIVRVAVYPSDYGLQVHLCALSS